MVTRVEAYRRLRAEVRSNLRRTRKGAALDTETALQGMAARAGFEVKREAGTAEAIDKRLHARENFRRIVKLFLGLRR